jgi:hypothetical protein
VFFEGGVVPFRLKIVCAMGLFVLTFWGLVIARQSPLEQFDIVLNPHGVSPLTALCEMRSIRELKIERVVVEGVHAYTLPKPTFSREHTFPIVGLRPNRTQTVRVEASDREGRSVYCPPTKVTTAPLPGDLPSRIALRAEPQVKGLYFCELESEDVAYQVLLNSLGEVVWLRPARPGTVLSRLVGNGIVATLYLQRGMLVLEDLTGRRLRSTQLALKGLVKAQTNFSSPYALWTVKERTLYRSDLRDGSTRSLGLMRLLGDLQLSFFGHGLRPSSALVSVEGQHSLAQLNLDSQHFDWVFGTELSWSEGRSSSYLTYPPGEGPDSPAAAVWVTNGGLITVESESGGSMLREYLVTLNSSEVKRNWTFPIQTDHPVESVSLTESFQDRHLVLGINQLIQGGKRSEVRIQEISQQDDPKLLLDLHIRGAKSWRVGAIQKVESPYGL